MSTPPTPNVIRPKRDFKLNYADFYSKTPEANISSGVGYPAAAAAVSPSSAAAPSAAASSAAAPSAAAPSSAAAAAAKKPLSIRKPETLLFENHYNYGVEETNLELLDILHRKQKEKANVDATIAPASTFETFKKTITSKKGGKRKTKKSKKKSLRRRR